MNIGVFKRHEISCEKLLEIVLYRNNGKSYCEIARIVGRLESAAFAMCKNFFKSRIMQNQLRVGRPEKFTEVFNRHVTFPVFRATGVSPLLCFC